MQCRTVGHASIRLHLDKIVVRIGKLAKYLGEETSSVTRISILRLAWLGQRSRNVPPCWVMRSFMRRFTSGCRFLRLFAISRYQTHAFIRMPAYTGCRQHRSSALRAYSRGDNPHTLESWRLSTALPTICVNHISKNSFTDLMAMCVAYLPSHAGHAVTRTIEDQ